MGALADKDIYWANNVEPVRGLEVIQKYISELKQSSNILEKTIAKMSKIHKEFRSLSRQGKFPLADYEKMVAEDSRLKMEAEKELKEGLKRYRQLQKILKRRIRECKVRQR
ncbi:MAG: hypothetical protein A4E52_00437 [Pelotomaculum sp. PtaB.Bin013]|uniref:Uncharacterized protein n=1 Tax=Pelotomaculum isophthalicicum JI TaxID=947010 RepID=A0A9X4GZ15_9FIRM|nr:hypothetical protein [Pelotomaculum isophthalicicum]MDF9408272.1 hypothetical protein [Pelotomaculum isophthalicicum JI]OPX91618.1 MAG: hypothetical protein A4E52_00437 [Pelotomaculum sp. PtaB.Bin013]